MNKETWKEVKGFGGFYEVSNKGNVRSWHKRGNSGGVSEESRMLTPHKHRRGYMYLSLYLDGIAKSCKIHRLVLQAFTGECPEGYETRHIDSDPYNNNIENLEWATHKVNIDDRTKRGSLKGANNGNCKLNPSKARDIRRIYDYYKLNGKYIANIFKVSPSLVYQVLRNETWRCV